MAIFGDPLTHRTVKLVKGIGADPLLLVRRNVGSVNIAQRGRKLHTTGEQSAARHGMAGGAVTSPGNIFPGRHRLCRATRRQ
ncbi:hypothetical protein D3C75_865120 [compost metagenome]